MYLWSEISTSLHSGSLCFKTVVEIVPLGEVGVSIVPDTKDLNDDDELCEDNSNVINLFNYDEAGT